MGRYILDAWHYSTRTIRMPPKKLMTPKQAKDLFKQAWAGKLKPKKPKKAKMGHGKFKPRPAPSPPGATRADILGFYLRRAPRGSSACHHQPGSRQPRILWLICSLPVASLFPPVV